MEVDKRSFYSQLKQSFLKFVRRISNYKSKFSSVPVEVNESNLPDIDDMEYLVREINHVLESLNPSPRYRSPALYFSIIDVDINITTSTYDSETCADKDKKCTICLNDFESKETIMEMPCSHIFHKACLEIWLSTRDTCPLCRFCLNRTPYLSFLHQDDDSD